MMEKKEVAALIREAERRMDEAGISTSSPYASILAHARKEWAQGNFRQALRDLDTLGREYHDIFL